MGRLFSKKTFKARMGEGSTWAGIAIIANVFGSAFGIPAEVTNVIVGLGASAAVALPEGKSQTPEA